ncbi:MAG: 5-oxoprolinase [Betaproteobacteria bacterium RIFCSPLOWO2_02_FULL_65_24]|nr:MAG: 5-oxoprolinase [Betaproteobacteria bacterium RIFCSPLOWO2_02_FULL_65_24]
MNEPTLPAVKDAAASPITMEIIRHSLLAIPNQIDVNITRTAYSPLIYEYKDYAVGVVSTEGRLISQCQGGIPIFMANSLGVAVRNGLDLHGRDGIEPGDVLICNHSSVLGQHLNNVVMYSPVFSGGELVAFMAVLVHWIDVGGMVVGSTSISTTEIYQEGLQFPSVKLWSRGKPSKDLYGIIESNTRFPRMLLGDVQAQLSGCLLGRDMIGALIEKYSLAAFRAAVQLMWDRSEAAARAAISRIPDGVYHANTFLDDDGIDIGKRLPLDIVVRVDGDEMTVDLSGVAPQVRGSINSGREGGAVTVARIAFKYLVAPDDPPNDGSFRALHVVAPEGTFLSARPGAAMGLYSSPLPSVIDTVTKALVDAAPERAAAGHHGNFGIHTFAGRDPATGELYVNINSCIGGWGAMLGRDGSGPFKTMAHGDTLDVPFEAQEALYPLRIEGQWFRTDSGGAGEFRGGLGLEKLITALAPCTVKLSWDRSGCPPWGIRGGGEGAPARALIERCGKPPEVRYKGTFQLAAGDKVRVMTSGGGGYGSPLEREPARVVRDVQLGYVSREAAESVYGVVLDGNGNALAVETARLRKELCQREPEPTG